MRSIPGRRFRAAVLAAALGLGPVPAGAAEESAPLLFEVGTIRSVTLEELLGELGGSRVIVFGERHNSLEDHEAQLLFLKALRARTDRLAVALEVFGFASQEALDRYSQGRGEEADLYREFTRNAAPGLYPFYRKILLYCRERGIPLVGIRAETDALLKLYFDGDESFSPEELARELPGYDATCEADERYRSLMKLFAATARPFAELGPEEGHLCDFFMGLDSVMGYVIARHARRHPERTILVLAGAMHAWKQGIPAQVAKHASVRTAVILPSSSKDEFLRYDVFPYEADYVWWHR